MNFIGEDFENKSKHITYGSVITISHADDPNAYILANGFSQNHLIVKNMFRKNEDNIKEKTINKQNESFFSSCLFLISPVFSNNLKQDALSLITRANQYKQNKEKNVINDEMRKIKKELSVQNIQHMKSKTNSEYKSNMEIFNKYKNKPISFNQSFQLIHLDSYKYLACYEKEAEHEKENCKLQLDEYPSEYTIFRIIPAFKYQKDAEQILHENETVLITHFTKGSKKEVFLHASDEISNIRKQKLPNGYETKEKDSFHYKETKPKKTTIFKREANASIEQKSYWKIQIFSNEFDENSMFLKSGDIIWIYHSELNASLSATKKAESFQLFNLQKKNFVFDEDNMKKNQEDIHIEFTKNNSFEEKFEDFKGNTCGVWIIEGSDYKIGERLKYGENFRLKHMSTGRYLTIKRDDNYKRPCLVLEELKPKTKLEEFSQKNTYFNFFPISSLLTDNSTKDVPINSFTYIRNANSKKWLDAAINTKWFSDNSDEINFVINPILKENFSEQEIFRIHKAPADLIWEMKFLNSHYPILMNFYDKIIKSNVFIFI